MNLKFTFSCIFQASVHTQGVLNMLVQALLRIIFNLFTSLLIKFLKLSDL